MVEPWVQRALLLSGTFACAGVVLAYRDYAIENGWPVGRWAFADASRRICPLGSRSPPGKKTAGGAKSLTAGHSKGFWRAQHDSNVRPPGPQPDALSN